MSKERKKERKNVLQGNDASIILLASEQRAYITDGPNELGEEDD
jgi:hypothetical protein